ncbi:DUF2339 domain-containing protein, partial [Gammaproteobacteria bacterium]|nr:DUF2339 domain-containing protein [Gammaproteobacteria bacterium]
MEIYVLIGLFCFVGTLLGWLAFFKAQNLGHQVFKLQKELRQLRETMAADFNQRKLESRKASAEVEAEIDISPNSAETIQAQKVGERKETELLSQQEETQVQQASSPQALSRNSALDSVSKPIEQQSSEPLKKDKGFDWVNSLKNNWMVWLGGACVGLSGVFLVKYSMDQGLLGPAARISAGIILGITLHVAAEWLRRNKETHPAFAALAAGGSITLFSALLAALHLYQMLNPTLVFIMLALVAIVTMALAVLHGPVLAGLGIIASYLVPLLVGDGPGGTEIVLIYSLIISSSALLLMRYVYREWLWFGVVGGGLGWWMLTMGATDIDGLRGLYLAGFAYLLLAVPVGDWLLMRTVSAEQKITGFRQYFITNATIENLLPVTLLLVIVAQICSIAFLGFDNSAIINWTPLVILLLLAGGNRHYLSLHPWALLILQLAAWLLSQMDVEYSRLLTLDVEKQVSFYWYCLVSTLVYSLLAVRNYRQNKDKLVWVSLAILAPLLFLGLSYVLSENLNSSIQWSLFAALLGGVYLTLASLLVKQKQDDFVIAWFFIGGHLAYSLAVSMFFREASMTLALAVQVISLSWVIKRFEFLTISWLLKVVVAVVIVRLSLNPWLQSYPVDVHWSLWTYGGSTLCCLLGGLQLQKWPELRQWAYGATIHLLALTIWAET